MGNKDGLLQTTSVFMVLTWSYLSNITFYSIWQSSNINIFIYYIYYVNLTQWVHHCKINSVNNSITCDVSFSSFVNGEQKIRMSREWVKEADRTKPFNKHKTMLFWCWASVVNAGPTLNRHRFNVSFFFGWLHPSIVVQCYYPHRVDMYLIVQLASL